VPPQIEQALKEKIQYYALLAFKEFNCRDIARIDFKVSKDNKIYLEGKAKIIYQNMTLEAEKILIDQKNNYLYAEGIIDTVDSLGNPVYKGTPIFTERGEEPIYGNSISYNFKTKRGKVEYGKTKMPPGYYKGEDIYKISEETMLVSDGYFTSCEYIDKPHFYFRSDKMRVKVKDKVVAKPVYFYIADVPLFVIPFGVFPNKRGRQSGILVPSYGESGYGGRFLKNMGYYWAPNDFIDGTFITDYYDKLGFTYRGNMSYVVRYILSGSVSGFYFPRDPNTGKKSGRWAIDLRHSQTIDPTLSIAASGKMQSDPLLERELSSDIDRRLNQQLTSNLTVNKKWKGTKNSMSLNIGRTENLQTGNISYTLPNLRFSRSQSTIYETFTGESIKGKRSWYQDIYFSYNSRLIRKGSKTKQFADTDSAFFESAKSQGVEHNFAFNSPQKIFSYFNITPNFSYREIWVDEITSAQLNHETNSIIREQKKQFAVRRTFNSGISLKTALYGLFEPNIGSLKFIRHKIDPQLSFTYTPNFSNPYYGYFTEITDTTGKITKIDKFSNNPFGGTPSNESQFLRMSVGNLFQAKIIDGEKENKIDLFTLNFSSAYNFKADSLKWQDLSTNFRASPWQGTSININSTHSFYRAKPDGTGKINKFLLDEGSLPRLLNLNAGLTFALSDALFKKAGDEEKPEKQKEEEEYDTEGIPESDYIGHEKLSDEFAAKNLDIPWRINFNLTYSYIKSNINNPIEKIDLGTTASVSLTKNWRVNWNARFDLVEKDIVYQSFQIYRDLHCWEMSFNWQPQQQYYSFQINVKSSVLKDIKMTKHPTGSARF